MAGKPMRAWGEFTLSSDFTLVAYKIAPSKKGHWQLMWSKELDSSALNDDRQRNWFPWEPIVIFLCCGPVTGIMKLHQLKWTRDSVHDYDRQDLASNVLKDDHESIWEEYPCTLKGFENSKFHCSVKRHPTQGQWPFVQCQTQWRWCPRGFAKMENS